MSEATTQALSTRTDGAVRILTIQSGPKANPLSRALQGELLAALADCASDTRIRAVVLTAAGRTFCVGADLTEAGTFALTEPSSSMGELVAQGMAELTNPIVLAMQRLPVPVVCAINGPVAGAGVGLALSADVVLMARSAYFYLPFMPKLGLVPDMGSSWFLARQIGRARATALTLLGDRVPAEQAVAWGLAWSCVDDTALLDAALTTASRLAALPHHAALETRQIFDVAETSSLQDQLEYERLRQRDLLDRPTFSEGVQAFLAKREPVFAPRS